jgi:hypothetical protein
MELKQQLRNSLLQKLLVEMLLFPMERTRTTRFLTLQDLPLLKRFRVIFLL